VTDGKEKFKMEREKKLDFSLATLSGLPHQGEAQKVGIFN